MAGVLLGPGTVVGRESLCPDPAVAAWSAVAVTAGWALAVDVAAVGRAVAAHGTAVARMLVSRDAARFHGGPQFTSTAALQAAASVSSALRAFLPSVRCPTGVTRRCRIQGSCAVDHRVRFDLYLAMGHTTVISGRLCSYMNTMHAYEPGAPGRVVHAKPLRTLRTV